MILFFFSFFLTLTFIAINYYLETINKVSTTVNTTYGAYGTILLHHTIYRMVTMIFMTCFNMLISYEQDYSWLKEKSYNEREWKEKDEAK